MEKIKTPSLKRSANDIDSFTEKVTPVSGDLLLIEDSAAAGVKKKIQAGNLPGGTPSAHASSHEDGAGDEIQIGAGYAAVAGTVANGDSVEEAIEKVDGNEAAHEADTANPHSTTKSHAGLGNVTNDAQLKRAAADINSFSDKSGGLVDADLLIGEDSDASHGKIRILLSNLWTYMAAKVTAHTDVAANTSARHSEAHVQASHTDTSATGPQLNTLVGGAVTTLHKHDVVEDVSPSLGGELETNGYDIKFSLNNGIKNAYGHYAIRFNYNTNPATSYLMHYPPGGGAPYEIDVEDPSEARVPMDFRPKASYFRIGGGLRLNPVTVSANFDTDPRYAIYSVNTAATAITCRFMTITKLSGLLYIIKDTTGDAATNNITLTSEDGALFDGASSYTINTAYGYAIVYCDGVNRFIVGSGSATASPHAASHADAGSDEIVLTGGYVPAAGTVASGDSIEEAIEKVDGNEAAHEADSGNPHGVTKTQVGLSSVTNDAQLKRSAGDINTFTEKVTPISADLLIIEDSTAGNIKKKIQVGSLPPTPDSSAIHNNVAGEINGISNKSGALVDADLIVGEDSDATYGKIKILLSKLWTYIAPKVASIHFLKTEHINTSAGTGDAGKPIKLDADGHVDATMINDADIDHGAQSGLSDDDHTQYSKISSGSGAPSSTPSRAGLIYIDTTADVAYMSVGLASTADWSHATMRLITDTIMAGGTSHTIHTRVGDKDFRVDEKQTLIAINAWVDTAGTGSVTTLDMNVAGTSILSTKITIDGGAKTSKTAATPAVISTPEIPVNAIVTYDIDGIASTTPGKGFTVQRKVVLHV